jgi:hypothetical protein
VGDAVGQPVYGWLEAAGGCWCLLDPQPGILISVQIAVFRNRVARHDMAAVVVSGLGGNAYWNESTGYLVVRVGRDMLWVDTGQIRAADKLAAAKALVAIVRKRLRPSGSPPQSNRFRLIALAIAWYPASLGCRWSPLS